MAGEILQDALTRDQNVCKLNLLFAITKYRELVLPFLRLPPSFLKSCSELNIAIQIPLLSSVDKIIMNLFAGCIEMTPFGVWVEGECLLVCK